MGQQFAVIPDVLRGDRGSNTTFRAAMYARLRLELYRDEDSVLAGKLDFHYNELMAMLLSDYSSPDNDCPPRRHVPTRQQRTWHEAVAEALHLGPYVPFDLEPTESESTP